MKKLLLFSAAAMTLAFAACDGGKSEANDNGFDSIFTQAQADSLVQAFGQALGSNVNMQVFNGPMADSTLSKKELLKGVQYILAADTASDYMTGVQVGFTILQQMHRLDKEGVKVDRDLLINSFRAALLSDTINDLTMRQYMTEFQSCEQQLQAAKRKYERAKLEASPEAIANAQQGAKYIDSIAALDPSTKILPSGVAIKIENAGQGDKVTAKDRASLKFKVTTANGRVVEQTQDEARNIRIASRPEGFQQGIAELAKGGKATIYVPGKLAYGVDDQRNRYGLEPNELLVYEVEVIDIEAPNDPIK